MPDDTKSPMPRKAGDMSRAWDSACGAMLDGNQQMLAQWLAGAQTMSEEFAMLAEARLRLAIEAWSALAACRQPEDIVDCYRQMASKAAEHCAGEVQKLSQLTMRMASLRP